MEGTAGYYTGREAKRKRGILREAQVEMVASRREKAALGREKV